MPKTHQAEAELPHDARVDLTEKRVRARFEALMADIMEGRLPHLPSSVDFIAMGAASSLLAASLVSIVGSGDGIFSPRYDENGDVYMREPNSELYKNLMQLFIQEFNRFSALMIESIDAGELHNLFDDGFDLSDVDGFVAPEPKGVHQWIGN